MLVVLLFLLSFEKENMEDEQRRMLVSSFPLCNRSRNIKDSVSPSSVKHNA
jgi:hypothetical protein